MAQTDLTTILPCRSCGAALPGKPLLKFEKMPATAQYLSAVATRENCVDFSVFQCPKCGLVQLDCPPVPYFREVIRAAAVSPEMHSFRLQQFREWLAKNDLNGKKILECGCGKGEFLEVMNLAGADGYGIEYGEESFNACLAKGLQVEKCYFEKGNEKVVSAPFDGFYILNYLEHIPDLAAYLQGIYNNLAEGGRGLVEVPNFDMMIANNTFAEFMTDHLYYFTASSLRSLLERNGFEVISEKTVWYNYILSFEVRKRPVPDFSSFNQACSALSGQLQALVKQHGSERTAVWGASHQAFALLALAGLHGKVRCIIDSAPFKQGKFSPATAIPIVPPESVAPGDIDLLIVMAGGYSDEVAKIARKKFGNDPEIYVLRENRIEKVV